MLGFTEIGFVEPASIVYCTKYMLKEDVHPLSEEYSIFKTFMMCSNGIGKGFADSNKEYYRKFDRDEMKFINKKGYKCSLPRYLKDKLAPYGEYTIERSIDLHNKQIKNDEENYKHFCSSRFPQRDFDKDSEYLRSEWCKYLLEQSHAQSKYKNF